MALKLAELDRKRSGYLDLAADGIMTREELGQSWPPSRRRERRRARNSPA